MTAGEARGPWLLREGYRFFFLAAPLFAVLAMAVWLIWLGVHAAGGMVADMPFAPAPHLWHAHEMIFGYAGAVLGGFFLTAVPNWTGQPAARGLMVAGLGGLWLAGRAAVWFSAALDPLLVAAVDLAFAPLLASKIASNLLRRPKKQNMVLLALLALYWGANVVVHLDWTGLGGPGAAVGLRAGLLLLTALIALVGGRITPAFTTNAMRQSGRETGLPRSRPWLERATFAAVVALPVLLLAGAPEAAVGAVALAAGAAQAARLAGWRPGWTLGRPILWSLHLGMAMLALGYLAYGLALLGLGPGESAALHVLAIGAVGGMTLAVMSRAALGHSGRPLQVARPIAVAYALIAAAALLRGFGSGLADLYWPAVLAAGALWIAGFTCFAVVYLPILAGPPAAKPS